MPVVVQYSPQYMPVVVQYSPQYEAVVADEYSPQYEAVVADEWGELLQRLSGVALPLPPALLTTRPLPEGQAAARASLPAVPPAVPRAAAAAARRRLAVGCDVGVVVETDVRLQHQVVRVVRVAAADRRRLERVDHGDRSAPGGRRLAGRRADRRVDQRRRVVQLKVAGVFAAVAGRAVAHRERTVVLHVPVRRGQMAGVGRRRRTATGAPRPTEVLVLRGTKVLGLRGTEVFGLRRTELLGLRLTEVLGLRRTEVLALRRTELLGLRPTEVLALRRTELLGLRPTEVLGLRLIEVLTLRLIEVFGLRLTTVLGLSLGLRLTEVLCLILTDDLGLRLADISLDRYVIVPASRPRRRDGHRLHVTHLRTRELGGDTWCDRLAVGSGYLGRSRLAGYLRSTLCLPAGRRLCRRRPGQLVRAGRLDPVLSGSQHAGGAERARRPRQPDHLGDRRRPL